MRTFTAREIELARELAGLWGKEVEKGDWYMDGEKGPILSTRKLHPLAVFETVFIPRLDDILQEIKKRGATFISVSLNKPDTLWHTSVTVPKLVPPMLFGQGFTALEAALQCLIEIIRKEAS